MAKRVHRALIDTASPRTMRCFARCVDGTNSWVALRGRGFLHVELAGFT